MDEHPVTIRVTQRTDRQKLLGIPIPLSAQKVSNGQYMFSDGTGFGNESGLNPLECLVNLLVNAELNRNGHRIGSIHAVLELPGMSRYYGLCMEKVLEIYARSEQTTVSVEYR